MFNNKSFDWDRLIGLGIAAIITVGVWYGIYKGGPCALHWIKAILKSLV